MIIVTAGIIERDGQILIAQRKKNSRPEYKWELPRALSQLHLLLLGEEGFIIST
jgi:hypothetical protein